MEKPRADTTSFAGLSPASLGMAMSVIPSRIVWGIALKALFRGFGVDASVKTGCE